MKKIKMTIELLSDTLSGSGEGFGAVIDNDVQYDDCGIPYISSKRIKGSLRNSLYDLLDMPVVSRAKGINTEEDITMILDLIFGKKGSVLSSSFKISDFFVKEYDSVKKWFEFLKEQYPNIYSNEKILSTFTNIRRQTTVNKDGVAEDHSLRTSRVVNKGLMFESDIYIDTEDKDAVELLALACANLKRIGTKRNRGLGYIRCTLEGDIIKKSISNFVKVLEDN